LVNAPQVWGRLLFAFWLQYSSSVIEYRDGEIDNEIETS